MWSVVIMVVPAMPPGVPSSSSFTTAMAIAMFAEEEEKVMIHIPRRDEEEFPFRMLAYPPLEHYKGTS